jgi:hypothetical protein
VGVRPSGGVLSAVVGDGCMIDGRARPAWT